MRIDTRNRVLCNNGTYSIANGIAPPCVGAGGEKNEIDLPNPYEVTCKDGTKDVGNGKNPPCIYNGGVKNSNAENTVLAPETFLQKNKTNLLIAGALVLGYLAYKKYKK
jgi:hypothetical protein